MQCDPPWWSIPSSCKPRPTFLPESCSCQVFYVWFWLLFCFSPTTIRRTAFILPMSSQLPFALGLRWWLLPLFGISPARSSCCHLNSAFDSLTVHAKFLGSGGSISIYLGFSLLDSLVILRQTFVFQEGLRVSLPWLFVSGNVCLFILERKFLTLYTYHPTVLGVTFFWTVAMGKCETHLSTTAPHPKIIPSHNLLGFACLFASPWERAWCWFSQRTGM